MKKLLPLLFIVLFSTPVYADIVWPSLYITVGMCSAKVIITGLLIELLFVKFFADVSWLKAILVTMVMNFITSLLGTILFPVAGLLFEFLNPFGSTFHWSHWLISYLFIILINTSIEGLVIKLMLQLQFKKIFWWLFIANSISVLMCILFYGITMSGIKL